MRFLASSSRMYENELLTPRKGCVVPRGIWAADNEAFTGNFNAAKFKSWLDCMSPFRASCLFVAVPDVVGNAIATLEMYREWCWHFAGWPLAFVAQDGQENLALPDYYDCLFVGGTTAWKMSEAATSVIRRAQYENKHIHIGRVNWWTRYKHFKLMAGSESWTCDGNRAVFDGRNKTKEAWDGYMAQEPLFRI